MKEKEQIQRNVSARQRLLDDLLNDMRYENNMHRYKSCFLRILMGMCPPTEEMRLEDDPIGRFLRADMRLTFEDLYRSGILPTGVPSIERAILKEDFPLPQNTIEQLGGLAKGRTDIYFLGVTYSGHTCMLAGLLKYLYETGRGSFVPHLNSEGLMLSDPDRFISGLDEHKLPCSTPVSAIDYYQYDIGERCNREVTFVEYGDGALRRFSEPYLYGDDEVWNLEPLGRCLKNDNRKVLFFLLDYEMMMDRNRCFSAIDQELTIGNVINMFSLDGRGKNGERGCIMSKVDTVAVVITKSDLMDLDKGRALSCLEREEIAMDLLSKRCKSIMNQLSFLCKKYGINSQNQYNPYVFTFSLGQFYIGNTVIYNSTDSKQIADFLASTVLARRKWF